MADLANAGPRPAAAVLQVNAVAQGFSRLSGRGVSFRWGGGAAPNLLIAFKRQLDRRDGNIFAAPIRLDPVRRLQDSEVIFGARMETSK
jgi:hypothetical protein